MGGLHKEIQRIAVYSFTAALYYLLISLAAAQTPEKSKSVNDKNIIYPAPRSTQDNRQNQQIIRGEYVKRVPVIVLPVTPIRNIMAPRFLADLSFILPLEVSILRILQPIRKQGLEHGLITTLFVRCSRVLPRMVLIISLCFRL
ncbi:hypothetical protein [Rickettsiella massiliensis]|uniref:hypothetical protein n=1 Tax=Rickettsiella massiliensis TaxID=676517 RepID=UPI00029A9651|nr:hypothetical protein [Rickettsiella massiliensis]